MLLLLLERWVLIVSEVVYHIVGWDPKVWRMPVAVEVGCNTEHSKH